MPMFHFHLVEGDEREHIGSLDLPCRGEAMPAGLRLTMQVLADLAMAGGYDEGLTLQATDDVGAVVYNFDVAHGSGGDDGSVGYRH